MTRFIHTSDWQLGKTWARLRPEAAARLAEARLEAIRTLGKLATEHGAEFIVVAGDVFEHNSLSRETLGRALEQLKALPVPVYLLPGNHDPLVADSIFYETQDAHSRRRHQHTGRNCRSPLAHPSPRHRPRRTRARRTTR